MIGSHIHIHICCHRLFACLSVLVVAVVASFVFLLSVCLSFASLVLYVSVLICVFSSLSLSLSLFCPFCSLALFGLMFLFRFQPLYRFVTLLIYWLLYTISVFMLLVAIVLWSCFLWLICSFYVSYVLYICMSLIFALFLLFVIHSIPVSVYICCSVALSPPTPPVDGSWSPHPPWQGIIGTMRCCVLDKYKRKQNMVPTVIEQDDFRFFLWYQMVSSGKPYWKNNTSQNLKITGWHVSITTWCKGFLF